MAVEHMCEGKWAEGPVARCPKHAKNNDRRSMRWGKKARASLDREAGPRGIDRGGYIHAPEGQ